MLRQRLIIVAFASGCGFQSVPFSSDATSHDAPNPDARVFHDAMVRDDAPAIDPLCQAPDTTGLVLCLELDDTGLTTAKDGSGLEHDATVANLTPITRTVPTTSQGAQIAVNSVIQTADSTDFDVEAFTLMLWAHVEDTPNTGGEYSLIDLYNQYRLRVDDQGRLSCIVETANVVYVSQFSAITLNDWDLLACTYDGTSSCGYVFDPTSNTTVSSCTSVNKTVYTGGTVGVSVGSLNQGDGSHVDHLVGKLDSARIFSRVLTKQQICVGGGLSGC